MVDDETIADFTEEDIEIAIELGELLRQQNHKECSDFIRSCFVEEE